MKKLLRALPLAILLALLLGLCSPVQAAASTVNVMSYNLKNTNYNFSGVSSMAKNNGADIVCMQEVNSLQYLGLNAAMALAGYDCTLGKSSGSDGITESDEHLPIYYKSSKYKQYSWGTFWLSDTPDVKSKFADSAYYRICTWACYEIIGTNDYILVFNTHLDFAADLMIRQLNVILSNMIAQSNIFFKAKNHMILAGDLNCANSSIVCKYLQGDSAYNQVSNTFTKQRLDEARQIAATTTPNSNGNYFTQPASGPTMDLDHIYVTHNGFHCDSYSVLSDAAGSDHLPILAKLRFKTDHSYQYRQSSVGSHLRSCSHCSSSESQSCSYIGDYCSLCGGSKKAQTFALVKGTEDITTGRYLMVSAATGATPGPYSYYAGSVYPDSGFLAMQSSGMDFTGLPETITLDANKLSPLVWYLSGNADGFTLGDAAGNTLNRKGLDLYLNKDAATVWAAGYSSSAGHCALRENNAYFLALRTDLNTIGHTDAAAPLFGCVGNTDTGNYKIFLYRDLSNCSHSKLSQTVYPPTCTQQGYTVYSCPDCSYSSTTDFIPPPGHSYEAHVTPPTEEAQGYTTHSCTVCGDSYRDSFTDPIYTLSFQVPAGVEPIAPVKNTEPIVLPKISGSAYLAPEGAQFLGWVTRSTDPVLAADYNRYIFRAGVEVTISANVTLHALYSYHEGEGDIERSFSLHNGSRSLKIGDRVILVATDYDYAMSATQSTSNRSGVAIVRSEDGSTITTTGDSAGLFTVGWGVSGNSQTGQISLKDESGYLRITDAASNTLGSCATLDAYSTWAMSRNTTTHAITLKNQGASTNHILRYQSSQNIFAGFNSGKEATIQFYYLTEEFDPTLYYVTQFPTDNCPHPESGLQNASAPTCTAAGYTGDRLCTVCGLLLKEGNSIPPTGHSYSYESNQDDTHLCFCSRCGHSELQNCSYENGSCLCGAILSGPVYDPNLNFTNHSLSLASSIKVNFVIKNDCLTYDSYRIVIEKDLYDEMGWVVGSESFTFTEFGFYNASYSKVVLESIAATEMCSQLRATIYGYKNGMEYKGDTDTYSVETYALSQLNKASSGEKLRRLCVDLLNYGAAAQIYKNYNVAFLANSRLTQEQKAYGSDPSALKLNSVKTQSNSPTASVIFKGNALLMESKVEIMFVFPAAENLYVDVSYTDSDGQAITRRYTSEDFSYYGGSDQYYSITVDTLSASEMSVPVTAKLYRDKLWQSSCTYSIESYCASKAQTQDALGECCTMMMLYGNSAVAYFQ